MTVTPYLYHLYLMAHRQPSITAAPESSNFFVRVTLLSLSGRKDNKTFRVVLLKGTWLMQLRCADSSFYEVSLADGEWNAELLNHQSGLRFAQLQCQATKQCRTEHCVV